MIKTIVSEDRSYQGRIANVLFKIGKYVFNRRAIVVPGHMISWMAALSFSLGETSVMDKRNHHICNSGSRHSLPPAESVGGKSDGSIFGKLG